MGGTLEPRSGKDIEIERLQSELHYSRIMLDGLSKSVTTLALAIDPTATHGPESGKLADFLYQDRQAASEIISQQHTMLAELLAVHDDQDQPALTVIQRNRFERIREIVKKTRTFLNK